MGNSDKMRNWTILVLDSILHFQFDLLFCIVIHNSKFSIQKYYSVIVNCFGILLVIKILNVRFLAANKPNKPNKRAVSNESNSDIINCLYYLVATFYLAGISISCSVCSVCSRLKVLHYITLFLY